MSEKIFTIKDNNNKDYKLTVAYNSFTIEFILQHPTYIREKYESGNLSLAAFQKKNKVFKQFDSTLKIADVIRSKIEKKQYSLQNSVLTLKFHNEYDNIENVSFELKPAGSTNQSETQKGDTYKKRVDDLSKKAIESNKPSGNSYSSSYKPSPPPQPKVVPPPPSNPKPTPPPQSKPKPVSQPPQKPAQAPAPPKSSNEDNYFYKPSAAPTIEIVGSYVPPSMNTKGTIFQRIDQCIKLKKDMKKTLEDIYNRLNDVKKKN